MSRIFKGNMRTWTETIELTDNMASQFTVVLSYLSVRRSVASLNILTHDVVNVLYYEH